MSWPLFAGPASLLLAVEPGGSGQLPGARPGPVASQLAVPAEVAADPVGELLPVGIPASVSSASASRAGASESLTLNLIRRMVAKGLLAKDEADELVKQAEEDTEHARAASAQQQQVFVDAAVRAALAQQGGAGDLPAAGEDTVRVTYVPPVVKSQIRDELRAEVLELARKEGWVAPNTLPPWVARLKVFGDVRIRGEGLFYPGNNGGAGIFPNFNAINTGSPFDEAGVLNPPYLNADQERSRLRIRARGGLSADLGDGFSMGMRIATGDSNTPVSTNQSLGAVGSGQGGNFSKYSLWLDRGFLQYEMGGRPEGTLAVMAGRFDNPFFSTDIIWDEDVGLDGIGARGRYRVAEGVTLFGAGGMFPVFNTDLNFATNESKKFSSTDKWLYGGQFGVEWKVRPKVDVKLGAALYDFKGVEGRLSDPYLPLTAQDAGNTDSTRPTFAQKGNTYRRLRNIQKGTDNNDGQILQFQYYGLATPFRTGALTARVDFNQFEPFQISLYGEYAKNLAFDRGAMDRRDPDGKRAAVNNRAGVADAGGVVRYDDGAFVGGDTAWLLGLRVGSPTMDKRWDWSAGLNYRYMESDAAIDGFVDSDFGVGGTNMKGFMLWSSLALSPRVTVGVKWMSATQVAGAPFKNDTLEVDFSGKF